MGQCRVWLVQFPSELGWLGFEPRVVVFRQQRSDERSELSEWLGVLDDDDDDDQDPRLQELLGLGGVGRRYGTGRLRALVMRLLSRKLGDPLRRGMEGLRAYDLERDDADLEHDLELRE